MNELNKTKFQIVVDKDTDIYDYDIYLNGESLKVGNKSKIEYDRYLEHMKQIKEHRKKLLEEKRQKLKQKKQEEQIKE